MPITFNRIGISLLFWFDNVAKILSHKFATHVPLEFGPEMEQNRTLLKRQNQVNHETPITSPSMSNEFKTDTDTDGNGFHGGMESDDVDSTADFHRKR